MQVATALFVDSRLCRRFVDLAADRVRAAGDGAPARSLFDALEPVYSSAADPAQRIAKFESIYRRLSPIGVTRSWWPGRSRNSRL